MFGFLPNYQNEDTISESQAPSAFRDLPAPKVVQNGDIIPGTYIHILFNIHRFWLSMHFHEKIEEKTFDVLS